MKHLQPSPVHAVRLATAAPCIEHVRSHFAIARSFNRLMLTIACVILIAISSCKKTAGTPPTTGTGTDTAKTTTPPVTPGFVDVYIGGADSFYACYWKNGIKVKLPQKYNGYSQVNSIYFSGTDMYAAGSDNENAAYWKNGIETVIGGTPDTTYASGISEANGSTYLSVGQTHNDALDFFDFDNIYVPDVASYDVITATGSISGNVLPGLLPNVHVASLALAGGNVYTAGYTVAAPYDFDQKAVLAAIPAYWINQQGYDLQLPAFFNGTATTQGFAQSIFVSGSDIYVAGTGGIDNEQPGGPFLEFNDYPVLWKNNVGTALSETMVNGATDAVQGGAEAVIVVNQDVYVGGYEGLQACYWKNAVVTLCSLKESQAAGTGIALGGTDVYVSGNEYDLNSALTAACWKNGTETILGTTGKSRALCVATVQH